MKKFNLYPDTPSEPIIHAGISNFSFLGSGEEQHRNCAPIRVAGELGWDLKVPETIVVRWDGSANKRGMTFSKPENPRNIDFASCGMGYGILTLKIPCLFDLEPGNFLWFKGPTNNPLSMDLMPIEGVVECDWFPSHITMNYKVLQPNKDIVLEKGSSYCRVLPYPKNYIETFFPEVRAINEDTTFGRRYENYNLWNRFMFGAKQFMRSYVLGYSGDEKVNNVPKIRLQPLSPHPKCPFAKTRNP